MATNRKVKMTASEIASLWSSHLQDDLGKTMLTYFLARVEDQQIRPIIERAMDITCTRMAKTEAFFEGEGFVAPSIFTEADVKTDAPRLFSDSFFLYYIHNMSDIGLRSYVLGLTTAARSDIREFYTKSISTLTDLFNRSTEVLLEKGLYVRAPFIPGPSELTIVEKESYLGELMKGQRPINAMEISTLWRNTITNVLGKAMVIGFSQTAQSEELRRFMVRGKDIAGKHVEIFSSTLRKQDVPSPITWDSEVTASTVAPFSDKVMMYHTVAMIATGLGNYGTSMSLSARRDIALTYSRLMAEVGQFADDGAELLIKYGWMVESPHAPNRDELARV